MRRLRADEVRFHYSIQEDDYPGYCPATGDDERDKEYEEEIVQRLDAGDILAWCTVTVQAWWRGPDDEPHRGSACMGGCNYAPDTPLEEIVEDLGLREEAISALMSRLEDIVKTAKCIQETLGDAEEKEQREGATIGRSGPGHRVMDLLDGDEGCEE